MECNQIRVCDKCGKEIEPWNNALFYDAALESLSCGEYTSLTIPWGLEVMGANDSSDPIIGEDELYSTFIKGLIIPKDPLKSIENVINHKSYIGAGRHLDSIDPCEGSPSRRKQIQEKEGSLGGLPRQAYELLKQLKMPAYSQLILRK